MISSIDSLELGLAVITLGGGRTTVEDVIDPKAGIRLMKKSGEAVQQGETIVEFYTDKDHVLDAVRSRISEAISIGTTSPDQSPMIISIVDKNGISPFSY